MNRTLLNLLSMIVVAVSTTGCGTQVDSLVSTSLQNLSPERLSQKPKDREIDVIPTRWSAPFPDRTNPFQMNDTSASLPMARLETQATDIVLLGFANVDRPKVMVKIRNETVTLGESDNHGGIRIVKITPPMVTLQQANLTWTMDFQAKSNR
jgi:hypothetical protein